VPISRGVLGRFAPARHDGGRDSQTSAAICGDDLRRDVCAGGALNEVKPVNLVVGLIDELRSRFPDLDETLISDLILGCVSP
ncbi:hypothetical protein BST36_30705, partial [Mycolicibacterium moriokaense]